MNNLTDHIGRSFKVLRVSLLDRCNFACTYCVCDDDRTIKKPKKTQLSVHELSTLIGRLHDTLHLQTVRLTGGEPLLYTSLTELIASIRHAGIKDIKMTTNGLLLAQKAESLEKAGLRSVNVSLDALTENTFLQITRRKGVKRVIAGITAAKDAGLDVKINAVLSRGENDNEILPLLDFAFQNNIKIRFLELMGMGHLFGEKDNKFFSMQAILDKISTVYQISEQPKKYGDTATYWTTRCGNTFGIIANESRPFCADCNRLRLDSNGNIYGCLSSDVPISLAEINSREGLEASLYAALAQKQMQFSGSEMSMLTIGG
ncbi:GTP 3',8-cyclase MoaA [Sphingobacterium haloxyli]|uniref:GTP 3',8-cyclase MoaA n=1 Tax=Sphingobacterium haloxyli TaxID=2100533 RepID=A0A2S9J847_9SPHI|nr:GTP 3',8-cyclase MoaA [Sphingobacterium haloxyli]PRD48966.1 GTP 3',8-cyclase MoaA [Sphingobacterium haloxyli]